MSQPGGVDRRQFLGIGLGAFAVAALPGIARPDRRLVRRSVPLMGTVAELAVVTRHPDHGQRAIQAAIVELRRVEGLMTRFRDDSDVGRANLDASRAPVAVSLETADVVRVALGWSHHSEGAFDPALGRVTALWDAGRRTEPPGEGPIRRFAGRELWRAIEIETGSTVPRIRFHDPDVALDLGGIAKGYGVDRAAEVLREHGAFDALVNVGGDLRVSGTSLEGDAWRVGVRAPEDPERMLWTLRLSDAAVATSGDYLQSFVHRGRRYHHLLDPASGEPRRSPARTLTVVAATCMTADAAATAAFGLDEVRSDRILRAAAPDARIAHRA